MPIIYILKSWSMLQPFLWNMSSSSCAWSRVQPWQSPAGSSHPWAVDRSSPSAPAFPSASHPAGTDWDEVCVHGDKAQLLAAIPREFPASVPCPVVPTRTHETIQDEGRV